MNQDCFFSLHFPPQQTGHSTPDCCSWEYMTPSHPSSQLEGIFLRRSRISHPAPTYRLLGPSLRQPCSRGRDSLLYNIHDDIEALPWAWHTESWSFDSSSPDIKRRKLTTVRLLTPIHWASAPRASVSLREAHRCPHYWLHSPSSEILAWGERSRSRL